MVRQPVQRGHAQHRVDRPGGRQRLTQVGLQHLHPVQLTGQPFPQLRQHLLRPVDGEYPAARQDGQQLLRVPPGPGAHVRHGLVPGQPEPGDGGGPPPLMWQRQRIVAPGIPFKKLHNEDPTKPSHYS